MRSTIAALACAMIGVAQADFYLYAEKSSSIDDGGAATQATGWKFYNGPPSCDDVNNSVFIISTGDVSGSKSGVRCEGCDSAELDYAPTVIEWNTDMGHYTWYADRNGDFVDLDNNVRGNCVVDKSDGYTCANPFDQNGQSELHCTSDLTV